MSKPPIPSVASALAALTREARLLGAAAAEPVAPARIPIEDAVVKLCRPPACPGYGRSAFCPPHAMPPKEARRWVRGYAGALAFRLDLPPEELLSECRFRHFRRVYEISAALEALAAGHGWEASKGLAAGSCKPVFCPAADCLVLQGGKCRRPDLARPSMEALGINVFRLARGLGWQIHPIGRDSDPAANPIRHAGRPGAARLMAAGGFAGTGVFASGEAGGLLQCPVQFKAKGACDHGRYEVGGPEHQH